MAGASSKTEIFTEKLLAQSEVYLCGTCVFLNKYVENSGKCGETIHLACYGSAVSFSMRQKSALNPMKLRFISLGCHELLELEAVPGRLNPTWADFTTMSRDGERR